MEPASPKRLARFAFLLLAALGIAWLAVQDYSQKVSTNIVDLIPSDERSPEVALVRSIVGDRHARVAMFALQSPRGAVNAAATQRFAEALRDSRHFEEVVVLSDTAARDALARFVFERRFDLLLPSWLEKQAQAFQAATSSAAANSGAPTEDFSTWLAQHCAANLDTFLGRPESVAFQDLVPSDPLLLVPTLASHADALGFARGQGSDALIWTLLAASPFTEEGQQPVFKTIETGLEGARVHEADLQLVWSGINRFAAESRRRISQELSLLNVISFVAVIGVACVFVRRLWKVLHLVPVILFSVLGAWVCATAVFDRLHILVFVVGSLLTGVAIDYGFYLYMQPALRPDEPYREKLRRLLKPLLTSCLTTVIGFSFLLFSELPLIRQLGVFVSAGLLSALVGAVLYFAQLDHPYLETRSLPRPNLKRSHSALRWLGAAVFALSLFGLLRLTWRDDVRELEVPAPELRANDLAVRRLFGDNADRAAYITRGATLADARAALDTFLAWHNEQFPTAPGASLAWLIPSPDAWAKRSERLASLSNFEADFRQALDRQGYTPEGFEPFFTAWRALLASETRLNFDALVSDVQRHLTGPLSLLFNHRADSAWFITLADHAPTASPPAELGTVSLSQLESLNTLFSRYRASALRLSAAGLGLVGLSVFVLYGFRRGLRVFMIPAGSCIAAFGLLGLMGQPLNLFHLLGAFLGVCLSHNYAIFSVENSGRREPPPPSIRLSALTTAASFGVLAFSQIPVVSALGTIVALIVLIALLVVEMEPLAASTPAAE